MCGIGGIWLKQRDDSVLSNLKELNDRLRHRGPDDEGYLVYSEGSSNSLSGENSSKDLDLASIESFSEKVEIALAHRRLSIIDTSSDSHQPMSRERYHIVYNGAVYNFKELRQELQDLGHHFETTGDTEVVLRSYIQWGNDCVYHFNGMWAFVVFDEENKKFFGSRDITGVKPMYFINDDAQFAFASEAFPLAKTFKKEQINQHQVVDFLIRGNQESGEESMFKGIFELKPAHSFEFNGELRTWKYYEHHCADGAYDEKAKEDLKKALQESVSKHLIADVPVGTCLSGGIDSSAIVGMVAGHQKRSDIEAFSSIFPNTDIDESDYAKSVVDHWGIGWNKTEPQGADFIQNLEELHRIQDFPLISSSTFAQYEVMRLAREKGVKVLLDGQGADELFGGYPQYRLAWINQIRTESAFKYLKNIASVNLFKELIRNNIRRKVLNDPAKHQALILKRYPELQLIDTDILEAYFKNVEAINDDPFFEDANENLAQDYFGEHLKNLLRYEDRNSMHFGIESRTPYADDRKLMDLCFQVSADEKFKTLPLKKILRDISKDLIPEKVFSRRDKMGFVAPHNQWVSENFEEFKSYFSSETQIFRSNIVDCELRLLMPQSGSAENYRSFRYLSTRIWESAIKH